MSKDDILTKFKTKDYNNQLEEILEKKEFSNDVKNLLLNMLYKIEAGYNDYKKVKIDILDKKVIIEEIVGYVHDNCAKITLEKPKKDETQKNRGFEVDYEKNSIKSYPNEKDLLKAIYTISQEDVVTSGIEDMMSFSLSNFLNIGYANDIYEIIRDFNGWNWYISVQDIESFEYNIIYQNLKILTNSEYLYNIRNDKTKKINFDKDIKLELQQNLDEEKVKQFISLLYRCILMLNKNRQIDVENIIEIKEENEKRLKELDNIEAYTEELFEEQKKYMLRIKKINKMLDNPKALNEEFIKRNTGVDDENKIFSISNLTDILNDEIKRYELKFKKIADKIASTNYKEEIKKIHKVNSFIENLDIDNLSNSKEVMIKLQKVFLKCFLEFILKAQTKKQIIELIYTFRYYCLLYYNEKFQIKDIKELKKDIESIKKILINKSIKVKMINELSSNEELNIEIISSIFELKNIDLKNIEIKAVEDVINGNGIQIEYLDNGLSEYTKKIEIENISEIKGLKFNKKLKIFS